MNIRRIVLCLLAVTLTVSWTWGDDIAAPMPAPHADVNVDTNADIPRTLYIVPIRTEITDLTRDFLDRCINEMQQSGDPNPCLVLDLNTPGGLVTSALAITKSIKALNIHTVAWVNTQAYSAGSMISLACDEIVIAPHAAIGDCAPIMLSPGGLQSLGKTERAKIESPILAEFRDSARAHGYPLALCEKMVTTGRAVYRIVNTKTNENQFVFDDELHKFNLVEPDAENKLDAGDWKIDKKIIDADSLLTMTTDEAMDYGFTKKVIANETELAAYLGTTLDHVVRHEANWSEQLVVFLTSPIVRGLLTILMLMGLYSEMQAPGLGLPGLVAVISATILFGAPYLTGLASVLDLLLVFVGIILIMIEIFVIPGFGVVGITGIAVLMIGLILTFVQVEPGPGFMPQLSGTWTMLRQGIMTIVFSLGIALVAMYFMTKHIERFPIVKRLMLVDGISAGGKASESPASPPTASELGINPGYEGVVVATLRPIGRAQIDGRLVDVVTTGARLEPGARVKVIEVHGNRIVVEEV